MNYGAQGVASSQQEAVPQEKSIPGPDGLLLKKAVSGETFFFLLVMAVLLGYLGYRMGAINMVNTLLNTAFALLNDTVFYILAVAVVAGALSMLLSEFGVIALLNRLLSPLMGPLYGLPGASVISVFTCYLSDNPAILTLCDDRRFRRYFKRYQLPALTNLGTAFGMGLIVTVFMMGLSGAQGENFVLAAVIGNVGAIIGSIISTRIFLLKSRKVLGEAMAEDPGEQPFDLLAYREVRSGSVAQRAMNALLEGGASGVKVGFSVVPGVLVICTLVMMLSNMPPEGGFTGGAYEGIGLVPALAEKCQVILTPLFGFSDPSCISVPITALGSAGGAIGLVPAMVSSGVVHANDVAVFTAMCMCWSGYLSTHVAMMDALGCREMTGHAILSHTIGGLGAGIAAHLLFQLVSLF